MWNIWDKKQKHLFVKEEFIINIVDSEGAGPIYSLTTYLPTSTRVRGRIEKQKSNKQKHVLGAFPLVFLGSLSVAIWSASVWLFPDREISSAARRLSPRCTLLVRGGGWGRWGVFSRQRRGGVCVTAMESWWYKMVRSRHLKWISSHWTARTLTPVLRERQSGSLSVSADRSIICILVWMWMMVLAICSPLIFDKVMGFTHMQLTRDWH